MTSRWKKVWADFWGNKSHTLLTIVIISVGTFAVGASNNLRLYMSENLDRDYLSAKPSEATLDTSPLDDDLVDIARSVAGVDAVEGRSTVNAFVLHTDGKPISIQFISLENPNNLTTNLLKPAKGETGLPPLGEKQILVDSVVSTLGYKPGDIITIKLSSGKLRQVTLAGYVHDITSPPYGGAWGNTIYAYATPDTIEWLGGSRFYNVLMVSVTDNQVDQTHVTEVAQALSDRMEKAGATTYTITVRQPGRHFSWNIIQGVFFLIIVLGYMMVFLSGFLIINTITALMSRQTRQIGIMKSIGAKTSQIFGMYVVLILLIGLVALGIAIPLANSAAEFVGAGMSENLNFFTLPYQPYQQTIVQQAIVALVIPLLAVILPIYNIVRVSIREALTDYGIGANIKPQDISVSKAALLIPRPIRLSMRNAFRRKTRLILTMFALILGGSIFIGVYNMWDSFDKLINDLQGYFLSDVTITFERYRRFDEVSPIALGIPNVSRVEGWLTYTGALIKNKEDEEGTQIVLFAPPSTSNIIVPLMASGRWLTTGDENAIVVSNHFVNTYPETKIGDWLTIKIDDKETKWYIVGIYTITVDTGIFYVNYEYLSHLIGHPDQIYSLQVLTDKHDAATQSRVASELRELYESHGIQVDNTQTATEAMASARGITDVVVYFMTVMAVLIAIVGGLGLMSTMSINVLERTREIGVMRALGASNGDIQSIVVVEGMVVGLISWVVSIVFSIPITTGLTYGVGMAVLKIPMTPAFSVNGIVYWLAFTLVLAAIASAVPARSASRLTVKDTLAYE
jgi:putative ABC transport system permease protein